MKFKRRQWRQASQYLMIAAALSVLAASWGFIFYDLILASTQWLLVGAVLAVFGLYARLES